MFIAQLDIVYMPASFKIGDTAACEIDGETAQLTWLNADTLVIGAADTLHIENTHAEDGVRCFVCSGGGDLFQEVPGVVIIPK